MIFLAILTGLIAIAMLAIMIYTVVTLQFHAIPKELLFFTLFCGITIALIIAYKHKRKEENAHVSTSSGSLRYQPASEPSPSLDIKTMVELPEKYHGLDLAYKYEKVKVCQIKGLEKDIAAFSVHTEVKIIQEPQNPYDNKAVAVCYNGAQIGYLFKGKMQDMANYFINYPKRDVVAFLSDISDSEIYIDIGFYKKVIPQYQNTDEFKLTGTTKKVIQENIDFCSEGDEVTISYDCEHELYEVSAMDVIGYVPKSKTAIFENNPDYYAFISEITTDHNDKYTVYITVMYDE